MIVSSSDAFENRKLGKSNKAILSLPQIVQNGKIRFTEQGEVINYRYGSSQIAIRHLEQIISAQLLSLGRETKNISNNSLIDGLMNSFINMLVKFPVIKVRSDDYHSPPRHHNSIRRCRVKYRLYILVI